MKKFPIDLSCLTEEEISQFQEDPSTTAIKMLLFIFGIAPQARVTSLSKGSFVTAAPSVKQTTTAL